MDSPADLSRELRPLGLGEILDRAVTLTVRYFIPLAAIYVVFAAVLEAVSYLASQDQTRVMLALIDAIKAGKPLDAALRTLSTQQTNFGAWFGVLMVLAFFVAPLPAGALMASAAALYRGTKLSVADAYRVGLNRWPHLLGVGLMYGLTAGALYFGLILVFVLLALLIAALVAALHGVGVAIAVVLGVAAFLVLMCFIAVVAISFQVSCFSCVVERLNFVQAYMAGLRRSFVGVGFRRALAAGLAYMAVAIGLYIIAALGQAAMLALVRSSVLGIVFAIVLQVATITFTTMFLAIFYFDLRVREEGLDLQLAAAAPSSDAGSA